MNRSPLGRYHYRLTGDILIVEEGGVRIDQLVSFFIIIVGNSFEWLASYDLIYSVLCSVSNFVFCLSLSRPIDKICILYLCSIIRSITCLRAALLLLFSFLVYVLKNWSVLWEECYWEKMLVFLPLSLSLLHRILYVDVIIFELKFNTLRP